MIMIRIIDVYVVVMDDEDWSEIIRIDDDILIY